MVFPFAVTLWWTFYNRIERANKKILFMFFFPTLLFFQLSWQLTALWIPARHMTVPSTPFLMMRSITLAIWKLTFYQTQINDKCFSSQHLWSVAASSINWVLWMNSLQGAEAEAKPHISSLLELWRANECNVRPLCYYPALVVERRHDTQSVINHIHSFFENQKDPVGF